MVGNREQTNREKDSAGVKEYRDGRVSISVPDAGEGDKEKESRRITKYLADEWISETRIIRFIMYAVLLSSIVIGARNAFIQHIRLNNCVSIRGKILNSFVERHKAKGRYAKSGYVPKVFFTYNLSGQSYTSDWLTSMNARLTRSKEKAMEFISKYPPGEEVEVYYLPDKPEIAFLLKSYVNFWYCAGVVLFSMVLCFFWWLCLEDDYKDRYRFWKCFALCSYWMIIGVLCYGYYFHHADRPYSIAIIVTGVIYFVLGFFWIFQLFYSKFYLLPRGLRWKNR